MNTKVNKFGYTFNPQRNTVSKRVRRSLHLFKRDNAWTVDSHMLDEYPTANFEYREIENGFTYTANAEKIRNEGHLIDYGHGQQVALPVTDWTIQPSTQTKLI